MGDASSLCKDGVDRLLAAVATGESEPACQQTVAAGRDPLKRLDVAWPAEAQIRRLTEWPVMPLAERPLPGIDMSRVAPAALLELSAMRDDYIKEALKKIDDPNILVNVVSRRVKQLRRGNRPLVESLEKLSAEDTALREIIEGKISFELASTTARS